jgi:NADPH:quinone reductase-like Zn-dependent oxidoreductase
MKAIVRSKYGSPDVLELKEVDRPVVTDDCVLVRVHASSVNAADLETLRGTFVVRTTGPLRPMYTVLGTDVAGQVEAVGRNVEQFRSGDGVFGDLSLCGHGAFAEYVCVPENALTLKPANMSFEEAASVPTAAVVALQHLRAKRQIQPGQKVLINGAGGSVGTFAVQIAKHFGAEVTGVDSAKKLDMLRSIGADHVIDYAQKDFTRNGQQYDLILDVVAHRSVFDYKRALSPDGICLLVGGSMGRILQALLLKPWNSMTGSKRVGLGMWEPNRKEDMLLLIELIGAGKVTPVIDRTYPLRQTREAIRYVEDGHARGKIVITV